MQLVTRHSSLVALLLPVSAAAADAPAAAPAAASGSLTQMLLGLVLVLGAIVAAGWLAKRFVPRHPAAGNALRVVAGTAVGQRERVVVVEVGTTWIVVGVAPGNVRALHTLPRVESGPETPAQAPGQAGFADWLKQFMEKRGDR